MPVEIRELVIKTEVRINPSIEREGEDITKLKEQLMEQLEEEMKAEVNKLKSTNPKR